MESIIDERGEAVPRRFFFDGRAVEVTEVVDRWPDERRDYFKVRGGNNLYILRHDKTQGSWHLLMFERGGTPSAEGIGRTGAVH